MQETFYAYVFRLHPELSKVNPVIKLVQNLSELIANREQQLRPLLYIFTRDLSIFAERIICELLLTFLAQGNQSGKYLVVARQEVLANAQLRPQQNQSALRCCTDRSPLTGARADGFVVITGNTSPRYTESLNDYIQRTVVMRLHSAKGWIIAYNDDRTVPATIREQLANDIIRSSTVRLPSSLRESWFAELIGLIVNAKPKAELNLVGKIADAKHKLLFAILPQVLVHYSATRWLIVSPEVQQRLFVYANIDQLLPGQSPDPQVRYAGAIVWAPDSPINYANSLCKNGWLINFCNIVEPK